MTANDIRLFISTNKGKLYNWDIFQDVRTPQGIQTIKLKEPYQTNIPAEGAY